MAALTYCADHLLQPQGQEVYQERLNGGDEQPLHDRVLLSMAISHVGLM
jgi:hypothetical protein